MRAIYVGICVCERWCVKCRNGDVDFGYPIFDVNGCYDGIKNCHSQGECKIDDIDNIFNIFFFIALHNFRGTPPLGGVPDVSAHTSRTRANFRLVSIFHNIW